MPPTRGHDLKLALVSILTVVLDAPHTGARLETYRLFEENGARTDAPHTGARLET